MICFRKYDGVYAHPVDNVYKIKIFIPKAANDTYHEFIFNCVRNRR